MSGRRFNATGAPKGGVSKGKALLRGEDWKESKRDLEYAEAKSAAVHAQKPNGKRKPKSPEFEMVDRVSDVAARAITVLASWWNGGTYDLLRSITIYAIYIEFAKAYGMRVPEMEVVFYPITGAGVATFLDVIRSLPYADLTPEHFGSAHEVLSGHGLVDGKIVATDGRRSNGVHFTPRSLTDPIVLNTIEPLFRLKWDSRAGDNRAGAGDPLPDLANSFGDRPGAQLLRCIRAMPTPEQILSLHICDPSVGAGAFPLAAVRLLGDVLVESWRVHGGAPSVDDVAPVAKRLIAIHCVYGVDICRFAVSAAKLALTLECRADSMPSDWLDLNIKRGDALVGLTYDQITAFHWDPKQPPKDLDEAAFRPRLRRLIDDAMAQSATARSARRAELAMLAAGGSR